MNHPIVHEGQTFTPNGRVHTNGATTFTCDRCHQTKPCFSTLDKTFAPEYGLKQRTNEINCWACCGEVDKQQMIEDGRAVLYLTDKGITNWPGTVVFPVGYKWTGKHNLWAARTVTFVRFIGPDDKVWSGRHIGDYNEVVHCRRTKLGSVYA